ncbi:hypothetical protein PILCRDRAFT_663281 [Piloderma croceum F 1598]|uniref:AA1-like domain-containing protein n=1 Tax=Piloderma croceum (strain F 1598) TaxID=765440 RepID=A0A0C3ETM0_PILCF|nr:hypothetical protein PILCRDRAFT_663281 [Piloderma croceum F 1598]
MIFVAYTIALVSIFTALVNASVIRRSSTTACHTIGSGYLSAYIGNNPGGNQALDLNSEKELTYQSGSSFEAVFQACPDLPNSTGFNSVDPTSSNDCLTVTNPSNSTGPFYVKSEKCTSDTKPSIAQTWGYGNDFGNVIFWAGSCGAGVTVNSENQPTLGSGNQIELSCNVGSWESMTLTSTA